MADDLIVSPGGGDGSGGGMLPNYWLMEKIKFKTWDFNGPWNNSWNDSSLFLDAYNWLNSWGEKYDSSKVN